ncbi:MAG: cation transporter [Bacteriovoracaceae bacterium]|nr:cation transporter [Bacteriovoracaceae bacterium]
MNQPQQQCLQHQHNYLQEDATIARNEKNTFYVVALTSIMMVVEIVTGYMTGSMALLADGWHMATHAGALTISLVAYKLAKSHKMNKHFTFGAGKFIPLGGYTSAIVLALVSLIMAFESILRLRSPQAIQFNEAIMVATIGLLVNILSAFILSGKHEHHDLHSHDSNLKSAYIHVIADALTSVLAIVALIFGKFYDAVWLDPAMGLVGSVLILKWAYNLCKETGWELLDGHAKTIDHDEVKKSLEQDGTHVHDIHIWRIAPSAHACEISVATTALKGSTYYKNNLNQKFQIHHINVEECLYTP